MAVLLDIYFMDDKALSCTGIGNGKSARHNVITDYFKVYRAVFLNVYGAQESIPRNKLRQPM
jgi:hypothetical protein